ncbi:hypothetical protein [Brucella intermedia]|uniref:hypothetical protein n=1 Tax=Brucella intermedia TaxID=94625 RepID=UPI00124E3463|nr:hypothetical protein [Brucella intermedia]KAB2724304.1 hypothetical protein F9L02_21025 [Brucella intermedia]
MTALLEFAGEIYGKATVRNAARFGSQSKTTDARLLLQQGIAPVRGKKIEALPVKVRRRAQILDSTMPRDGAAVVMVDDLATAIWSKAAKPLAGTPASTLSTRRKKLSEYRKDRMALDRFCSSNVSGGVALLSLRGLGAV